MYHTATYVNSLFCTVRALKRTLSQGIVRASTRWLSLISRRSKESRRFALSPLSFVEMAYDCLA